MDWESFLETYGYWAVLIGSFFEGETILLLAGFAAQRGYLDLSWVMVTAFAGTLCGDQVYFLMGRWHSKAILDRRPSWKARTEKARRLLDRYRIPLILSFRFLIGVRSAVAMAIGMSSISIPKFMLLNTIGAMVWALILGIGGFLFGNALEAIIGDFKRHELPIFGGLAITGLVTWIIIRMWKRRMRLSRMNQVDP